LGSVEVYDLATEPSGGTAFGPSAWAFWVGTPGFVLTTALLGCLDMERSVVESDFTAGDLFLGVPVSVIAPLADRDFYVRKTLSISNKVYIGLRYIPFQRAF
jgi:hypothetical protein